LPKPSLKSTVIDRPSVSCRIRLQREAAPGEWCVEIPLSGDSNPRGVGYLLAGGLSSTMQSVFSTFPGNWPGLGPLLLRVAIGGTLIVQGAASVDDPARASAWTWIVTLREKERIVAARVAARPSTPSADSAVPDGLNEVSSFLERFEAEQKARKKAHNDRAALRRKALAQGQRPA
jgi:hypothetical protein